MPVLSLVRPLGEKSCSRRPPGRSCSRALFFMPDLLAKLFKKRGKFFFAHLRLLKGVMERGEYFSEGRARDELLLHRLAHESGHVLARGGGPLAELRLG